MKLSHASLVHLMEAAGLTRLDLSQCAWVSDKDLTLLKNYRQLKGLSLACCSAVTHAGKQQPLAHNLGVANCRASSETLTGHTCPL